MTTLPQWLAYADFLLITCLLLFISWQDILFRIISNKSLIVLLFLVIPFVFMQKHLPNFIAALVVLSVFFSIVYVENYWWWRCEVDVCTFHYILMATKS